MAITRLPNGLFVNKLVLDTTINSSPVTGEIGWSTTDGGPVIGMQKSNGDQVTQSIGMEDYFRVVNQTGSEIANGACCMAVGAVGNSGKISVGLAIADGSIAPIYIMGVATEAIAAGSEGFVTEFGVVRDIDTRGQDGETWSEGDVLWASPVTPGNFTNVEPIAPNIKVPVALVIFKSIKGLIFVRATHGSRIQDLHDVHISNLQDGDVLKWVAANSRWENKVP